MSLLLPSVGDIESLVGQSFTDAESSLIGRVLPAIAQLLAKSAVTADTEIDKVQAAASSDLLSVLTFIGKLRVLDGLVVKFTRE
jgi:hypothetical protein